MDRMTFIEPVNIGELLTCSATVNAAWRTSMEVGRAGRGREPAHRREAPHLHRLPDHGRDRRRTARPIPVPPLLAESEAEKRRRSARPSSRRRNRLAEREADPERALVAPARSCTRRHRWRRLPRSTLTRHDDRDTDGLAQARDRPRLQRGGAWSAASCATSAAARPSSTSLVVDDGSTDTTAAEAEAAGAVVIRHPFNLGIGGAMQSGYKYALRARLRRRRPGRRRRPAQARLPAETARRAERPATRPTWSTAAASSRTPATRSRSAAGPAT